MKDAKAVLRAKGNRATPARVAILKALTASREPMSMAAIRKTVGSKADQATLYRTMELLETQRIVRQVNFRHRHVHYELDRGDHHHHLICYRCGTTEDFEGCGIEEIAKRAMGTSRKFAAVADHAFELFGLCIKCAKSREFTKQGA